MAPRTKAKEEAPAPKGRSTKKETTTQLNTYDEELARFAQEQQDMEKGSGGGLPFISCKGGEFSFGGNVIGEEITVVVLNHVKENCCYLEDYDSDNPLPPDCFAFGTKDSEMAPHENVKDPICDNCADCPNNEFGSADKGKGKLCKNVRRLQVITEESLDDIENAEVVYLKVPVMSVKGFSTFVEQVTGTMKLPTFAVLAEISLHPDKKAQFKQSFKVVEKIKDREVIEALMQLRKDNADALVTPYAAKDAADDDDDPPARGRGKDKGRGRGRDRDEDDDPPARGRGRGKKDEDDDPPARGRGRKPAVEDEDDDPPARGRGRAKKEEEPPARGRGRRGF